MVHEELKFVNREKECLEIINELVSNVDCVSLSKKTLIGFGQSYGAGKTSIGLNLISVAEHSGFFERFHGRTDKQLQTFLKLQQSIVVLVDFRTLELESKTPFKNSYLESFIKNYMIL
jgi:hypothetical protein